MLRLAERGYAVLFQRCFTMTISMALSVMPKLVLAADQALLLELQVNGYSVGQIGEFVLRDGALLARRGELTELGFRLPAARSPGKDAAPDTLVNLSELPSLTWRLDQATQTLAVVAADELLLPALLDIGGTRKRRSAVESGTGATLNYDLNASSAAGRNLGSGLLELRAFSPRGVVSSGLLAYAGQRDTDIAPVIRLDSTYTFSDPGSQRRLRVGDFIAQGLAWARPTRLGGAQITSDFSMRPDLVTFPLPSLSGSAAVPSTLDVLVNGNRLLSRPVGAGPFEIPQLPVVIGAGNISMTLTNALGQQVQTTLPFYASSSLLAPGLQTFAVQAGAVRRNWGVLSNDYGQTAASASYRRGLSPVLTVEATAEGTAGTVMAGGGAVFNAGNVAVLNVAAAGSTGSVGTGALMSAGVQRVGPVFSFNASATVADARFQDIAAVTGDPFPRRQMSASTGMSLGRFGSVGIAYAHIRRDAFDNPTGLQGATVALQPGQSSRVLSASYSVQVRGVAIYATAFRDLNDAGNTFDDGGIGSGGGSSGHSGVMVGLTIPLGARSSAGASVSSSSGRSTAQVQAQQSAVSIGDWGYQAYATSGNAAHQFAQVETRTPWALLSAGVDQLDGQTSVGLKAAGSLSMMDGSLFASNTISDSFAVVDTNGLAGVRVLHENREAGLTNAGGRLLVPGLRAFELNHLAVNPGDIPQDATLNETALEVRPQDRSGVVVRFPVRISRGALLQLVDQSGAAVPIGSTATLQSSGATVPVGYDGAVYVEGLEPRNEVTVDFANGQPCRVSFAYHPVPGEIPSIGPLTCWASKP